MKRIMIVGSPRSGTTLLQQLMSGYPDCFSPKETRYFPFLLRTDLRRFTDEVYIRRRRFVLWKDYTVNNHILEVPDDPGRLKRTKTAVRYFFSLMDQNSKSKECDIWVEKTPSHLFYIDCIQKYFVDVHFIHILRDPRDVVASLIDVGRRYPEKWPGFDSLQKSVHIVNASLRKSAKYKGCDNHHFVFYHDLVQTSKKTMQELCQQLNMPFKTQIFDDMKAAVGSESTVREDELWKKTYGNEIEISTRKKYYEYLSDSEREFIEGSIHPRFRHLGSKGDRI